MFDGSGRGQSRSRWPLVYGLAALIIACSLALGGTFATGSTRAQDVPEATEIVDAPADIEQPPVEEVTTVSEISPIEETTTDPETPPLEEPPAISDELDTSISDSENPPDTGTVTPPEEATEAPLVSTLSYAPAATPQCLPAAGQSAIIAQGALLDYDCTFDLAFSGQYLAPADIVLDWTARATVEGGWAVQLLPPPVDPQIPSEWTAALADTQFAYRGNVWDTPSSETADSLDATSELTFGLRVHRAVCSEEPQTVRLDLAVDASLPALAEATVERLRQQPDPYRIAPELAPIPEPSVAFTGMLDFGEILLTSEGPVTPLEPATAQLTITGLDQACGEYRLELSSIQTGAAPESIDIEQTESTEQTETTTQPTIGLALATIDETPLPDGDCALSDNCLVAIMTAGPDAEPSTTITLGIALVLPDQPRAAVFATSLTASLDLVTPPDDLTVAALPKRVNGSS